MPFTKEGELLLNINGRVNRLMDRGKPNVEDLRLLENDVRALKQLITAGERHERQAQELEQPDAEPVRWLGEIGTFCSDLCFHARRLRRDVRGEFNGVPLVATPHTDEWVLVTKYVNQEMLP